MNTTTAAILGVVEGLTEFLPISSTFHLILTSNLLRLSQSDFLKLFEVVIQAGAVLSVATLYFRKIYQSRQLSLQLLSSFIPTAVVGMILYKVIKNVFFNAPILQLTVFVIVGLLFVLVEKLISRSKKPALSLAQLSLKQALVIGLAQSAAVIPGVSRSGAVLLTMLVLGFDRSQSADYAFMLSLPTILAAAGLDLLKSYHALSGLDTGSYLSLLVGIVISYLTALWVMRWLIQYLKSHTLEIFGYYRLALGLLLYFLKLG